VNTFQHNHKFRLQLFALSSEKMSGNQKIAYYAHHIAKTQLHSEH